jgi:hypothetical protein
VEVACPAFALESYKTVIGLTDRLSRTNVTERLDLLFWAATRQNPFDYRTLEGRFLNSSKELTSPAASNIV